MNQLRTISPASIIRPVLLLATACAMVLSLGCSFIASSKSSSDIISSPFKSSSKSFGGDEQETAFLEETEGYTSAYVAAGSIDHDSFQKGLSDIAARRGISDWEANPATWTSVGRGLSQAELSEAAVVDYAESWSAGNEDAVALVLQGYSGTR